MHYGRFLTYNVVGAVAWVGIFLFGGYFFGGIPFVEDNLMAVLAVVVLITIVPLVIEYIRHRRAARVAAAD